MAARAKAAAKPKGPGRGNRSKAPRGRVGAPAPKKSAAIHNRHVVHPKPRSPRHDPAGGHLPEEMVGGFKCKHCGWPGWREHRVVTKEGAHHATLAFAGCTNCGTLHATHVGVSTHANQTNAKVHQRVKSRVRKMSELGELELNVLKREGALAEDLDVTKNVPTNVPMVAKDVDTSATELQRSSSGGRDDGVGHRQGCPRGGDAPCGRDEGGRCTLCKYQVQDHQAIGKTGSIDVVMRDLRKIAGLA